MAAQTPKIKADADGQDIEDRKTRIFISYSRKDSAFAERLRDGLIARQFEAYLDKHDIRPGEPWQERIGGLITRADMVIFCLSPNFVASKICDWEVNEAERVGKRLLPIVLEDADPEKTPGRLKRLNYIFMRAEDDFVDGLSGLQIAINTDIGWIHEHTRLTERAAQWQAAGKSERAMLRSEDISDAENWLTRRPHEAPDITEEVGLYISASRKAETARQKRARLRGRIITAASLTAATIMGFLGWQMYGQWQEGLRYQSIILADLAQEEIRKGDAIIGQLLALEALRDTQAGNITQDLRPLVPQAQFALDASRRKGIWRDRVLKGHEEKVTSVAFSLDGGKILTGSWDKTARLWDVSTGQELQVYKGHEYEVTSVAFSPDGGKILTGSHDETAQLWEIVPIQKEIDRAKRKLTRCLTLAQRKKYHLSPTPPRWCYTGHKWPYHDHAKTPPPPYTIGERALQAWDLAFSWLN